MNNDMQYQLDGRGHRGSRAVQRLVEYAPASGGLALWMQHRDVEQAPTRANWVFSKSRSRWIIGNDGTTVFYGPAFEQRSLSEQTGLVAHQVLHVALRHVAREKALLARSGSLDAELFAVCADAIVNSSLSHLQWLTLPEGSLTLDTLLIQVLGIEQAVDVSLQQWDCESLYRAIDDRDTRTSNNSQQKQDQRTQQGSQQSQDNSGGNTRSAPDSNDQTQSASSSHATANIQSRENSRNDGPKATVARQLSASIIRDLIPAEHHEPELETEKSMLWRDRLNRAQAADEEQSLMRQLLADNQPSRTPWELVLRTRLQRALALQSGINWSRPNRSWIANQGRTAAGHRLPWQPGSSYTKTSPRLCVMVDVSGSVEDALMQQFANEIDRIIRTLRTDAYLIIGDDKVRSQSKLKSGVRALRELSFAGGGGTDFKPLINAANQHKPDLGLFLTDLEGPAGKAPSWPMIWAVPGHRATMPAPFGERILLD